MSLALQKKYLIIIEQVKANDLPNELPSAEKEKITTIKNLISDGYISGNIEQIYGATMLNSFRVNFKGEEALRDASFINQFARAVHNVSFGIWSFLLGIFSAVIGCLIKDNL